MYELKAHTSFSVDGGRKDLDRCQSWIMANIHFWGITKKVVTKKVV